MVFTKWSDTKPDAMEKLRPDIGLRSWLSLDTEQRRNFLLHLNNKGWLADDGITYGAMASFAEAYKANNFCPRLLEHGGPHTYGNGHHYGFSDLKDCCEKVAQADAVDILTNSKQDDVVYEVFSYYAEQVHADRLDQEKYGRFLTCFNDIAEQYGLDIMFAATGIVPRQEHHITEDIYVPTLQILADPKWQPVSRDLGDAFSDFRKGSAESYSACITHAVSALQGFLQIAVHGKTGKGEIAALLAQAIKDAKVPTDPFTNRVFKDIESILMQERQSKGDPHPKAEYANEKTARLVLNLVMVFLQHCLQ